MRKLVLASALVLITAAASYGLDLAGMDPAVKPGDDFFAYANGKWVAATTIPPDRSSWGVFATLAEKADKRTADLIRGTKEQKVADYYAAYMDEKTIEAKGLHPIDHELAAIRAIGDKVALARYAGSHLRADVDPLNATNFYTDRLFGLFVSPDFDKPSINTAYLLQGGIGMPDRDYYLGTDEHTKATQAKYRDHIVAVLKLAGIADAANRAARIYALEHRIAEAHVSRTDSMDVHKANNRWARTDFASKAPGLDWPALFGAAGLNGQHDFLVWHPSGTIGVAKLAGSEPLDVWKDYLLFHAIDRASPLLPKAFVDENFRFYGTALSGATELRARWKRAVTATNLALGDAHPSRLPSVEVEGNAQADVDIVVWTGHIRLTPEIEHRVRTKSGLKQPASGRIHLRAHGAKLRVVGHRPLYHLVDRDRRGGRRRLGERDPPAG